MKRNVPFLILITILFTINHNNANAQQNTTSTICNHSIVGYWHSFDNGISTVIKLRDVPCYYNVVDIAFLEGASPSDPTIVFRLDTVKVEKESELIDDIKLLKSRGTKVLASIGGANGAVSLSSSADVTKFVNSTSVLIDKFGFEGLDIDIEGGAISLAGGDNNLQSPTTPVITNLISAIKQIKQKYGSSFWITMAPEVAYVQGGYTAYANIWGAYLPLIYGLQNELEFIHVQYYNGGGGTCSDGKNYNQGTADNLVAQSDMLLSGFKMANGQQFPALREDQVSIGLPATTGAAGSGVMAVSEITKALDYITKGTSFGGTYVLPKTFPNFRGIMTWSVNWDNKAGYGFGKTLSQYFCNTTDLCSSTADINNKNEIINDFNIFPNPASDVIHFNKENHFASVTIYNTTGKLVKKINNFYGNEISIKKLPAGLYHIRLLNDDHATFHSFIKS